MKKIEMIALDMDGTLLDKNKNLSKENEQALEKALDAGIRVVPATGRTFNGVHPYFVKNPRTPLAICSNGAVIFDLENHTTLHSATLSKKTALEVFRVLEEMSVVEDIFTGGHVYTDESSFEKLRTFPIEDVIIDYIKSSRTPVPSLYEWVQNLPENAPLEKFTIFFKSLADIDEGRKRLSEIPNIHVTSSLGMNLEVNDSKATKGQALQWLSNYLNISMDSIMSFGDNENDLDMLKLSGWGVAMDNAIPKAKEVARLTTLSNDEHGVAKAIEKYAL